VWPPWSSHKKLISAKLLAGGIQSVILCIQQQLLQSSVDATAANAKSFDCTSPSAFVSILPLLVQKPAASTGTPFPHPPKRPSQTDGRTDGRSEFIYRICNLERYALTYPKCKDVYEMKRMTNMNSSSKL
jgi:hypothetical protein